MRRALSTLAAFVLAAHCSPMLTNPPTARFPFPTVQVDTKELLAFLHAEETDGVTYQLGAKAKSLSDAVGVDRSIDCSGYVRLALYEASHGRVLFVDGSAQQHDQCDRVGFKKCDPRDVGARDGVLRIAFLSPDATPEGIGHVMLVLNGATLESHGHHGPDSRPWGSCGFMAHCVAYVLALPA